MADSPLAGLAVGIDASREQERPQRIVLVTNFSVAVELMAVAPNSRFAEGVPRAWAYPLSPCCQADLVAQGCAVCGKPMDAAQFFFISLLDFQGAHEGLVNVAAAEMDLLAATMAANVIHEILLLLLQGPPWPIDLPSAPLEDTLAALNGWAANRE